MKEAQHASRIAVQKARRDHAAAVKTQDALKVDLQKAQQRYAAASKSAAAALLDVEAKEAAEGKANAELQLATRAVKRQLDNPSCPKFKKQ